ncbi:MAG: NUDIX hydrolase [Burkholderiales bacterium]|nr:NUDIX hydrolase [Burkholderiales bacterium]
MKKLSCGILVMNAQHELLLCHATGTWHWDIPKGGMDDGETPRDTALRETAEETGLRFEAGALQELGRLRYRPDKALHLFAVLSERFDAAGCHCHSHFVDGWGRRRPEMDGFEWTPFTRVHRRVGRHMATLLTQTLSLPTVLAQLQAPRGDAA